MRSRAQTAWVRRNPKSNPIAFALAWHGRRKSLGYRENYPLPPSSSGLGHLVLSQETGVRFPVGV